MKTKFKRNLKCFCCNNNDFKFYDRYYHGRRLNIKNILICNNCKLKQADLIPDDELLKSFYNDINTRQLFELKKDPGYSFKYFDSYLKFIFLKTKLNTKDELNVIDIAGNGRTLLQFKNLSKWNALGIEPDKIKCKILNFFNLNYINDTFQNIDFKLKDNFYNLAIISQVLEHISDPKSILKIIHNKLRPNGYIWIDVPLCNKNYFSSRIIDDVGHLYFFDQNTLRNLINDCNFDIVASGSFGKKIATSRKLTSSILLLIKYYLHRYLPLKILNLRKNFQKKNDDFKINDVKEMFNSNNTNIDENNFENSKLFFLLKKKK